MIETNSNQKLLVFSLFTKFCALPISCIEEIIPLPQLIKTPGMPSLLEGYFDLGGRAVAVINLNQLLGLPKFKTDIYCPLICIKCESFSFSIIVHRALFVRTKSSNQIEKIPPEESLNGVVTGLFQDYEKSVSLLSSSGLLLEKERQLLSEFSILVQKRLEGSLSL